MHDIYQVPNVQWKTPDDAQRNCPKHVDFLDKINLGKKLATMHGHMNLKKAIIRFVISVRPSVCQQGTTRLSLDGFMKSNI